MNLRRLIKASLNSTEFGAFFAVIVLSIILTIVKSQFLTVENLNSVARGFSFIAIAATGSCLVMITGGIDLSVGSVMGLAGVIAAFICSHGFGTIAALLGAILVGAFVGLINGVLITKAKLAPFIVTLGMLSICRGFVYVVTGGWPMQGLTKPLLFLGQAFFLGVPIPVWIMVLLVISIQLILRYTTFGWYVYSIGGNEEATRLSGVAVDSVKIRVYVLAGVLASIGGILLTARLGIGETTIGNGYELHVISALVLGGVSLSGGLGSAISAFFGAAVMGILRNALVLLAVSSFWQQVVIGTVVLLAVLIDRVRLKYSAKKLLSYK